ncbi:hypothetical protein ACFVZD_45855 [Streptomyces sp. NPDC058287]|uniref:hypothetical protein n=1 Tax=Streptomyces sp. NPDC058287 TaxID=3346423 RepID=UPI0036E4A80D
MFGAGDQRDDLLLLCRGRSPPDQLRLYARCSAGTHAEVTIDEARFIFLQTYIVLGEILTLSAPQYDDS